jgi:phosphate transport system substrate-binding protein
MEELALIFGGEATWSDVRADWPDEPILRFIPGTDSGTFDYFVEEIFDRNEEPHLSASNLQFLRTTMCWSRAFRAAPLPSVTSVMPTMKKTGTRSRILNHQRRRANMTQAVEDGTYPLARPLFIYSDATVMAEKPQVAEFINFYLTYVMEEVEAVGYFPASTTRLQPARQGWINAMRGGGAAVALLLPAKAASLAPRRRAGGHGRHRHRG